MMLNGSEISAMQLICSEFDPASLREAGYDLRIKTLMSKNSEEKVEQREDRINLAPQGIAVAISKETLRLPMHICAYASVKTSLSREGILAINTGVVDPGWEGPLSSLLLNFGTDVYGLRAGDPFIRLTFHRLPMVGHAPPVPLTRVEYENQIKDKFVKHLAASFMDLEVAAEKGSEQMAKDLRVALLKYLPAAAVFLALITLFLNYGVLSIASRSMPYDVVETRAKALVKDLQEKLNQQAHINDDLTKAMNAQKQENEKLENELQSLKHRANP